MNVTVSNKQIVETKKIQHIALNLISHILSKKLHLKPAEINKESNSIVEKVSYDCSTLQFDETL